jgi:outer membrane lipoprotein-sorting protein
MAIYFLLFFTVLIPLAPAETADPVTASALQETQSQLKDPKARQTLMDQVPDGASVDGQVKALAGSPENTDAIYALAASVLGKVAEDAKNDPQKMQELLKKASDDPASFAKGLNKKQQDQLREIAAKIGNPPIKSTP